MSDDDMPPDLDDLSETIKNIRPQQTKESGSLLSGDYTKTREEIQEEVSLQLADEMKEKLRIQAEKDAKKPKEKKKDGLFGGGMTSGFLSGSDKPKKSSAPIEVKVDKDAQKKAQNPLQIQEVQEAMKFQDTLNSSKDQWMNPMLLNAMATNPRVQKLFTNPEYMQAISRMQTHPKETMEQYKNNAEFMSIFQEFCKIMGLHFESLSKQEKEQEKKKVPDQPLLKKVEKVDKEAERINDLVNNDPEVKQALQDPKVQQFIAFLQTQKQVDFHQIMNRDKDLARKIQVLVQKGVLNIQRG